MDWIEGNLVVVLMVVVVDVANGFGVDMIFCFFKGVEKCLCKSN